MPSQRRSIRRIWQSAWLLFKLRLVLANGSAISFLLSGKQTVLDLAALVGLLAIAIHHPLQSRPRARTAAFPK